MGNVTLPTFEFLVVLAYQELWQILSVLPHPHKPKMPSAGAEGWLYHFDQRVCHIFHLNDLHQPLISCFAPNHSGA